MNEDADQEKRTDEILRSLLEDDDDEGLVKEVTGFSNEYLDQQLVKVLPGAINQKQSYLKRACKRTFQHTNSQGESYVFGQFGPVTATLLYLHPQKGWTIVESLKEEDENEFKELYARQVYLPLGSIIRGTSLPEDVVPAMIEALRGVSPEEAEKMQATWDENLEKGDREYQEFLAFECFPNKLQAHCPPYTYFGSNEGDGTDMGVWVNREKIEEDLEYEPEKLIQVQVGQRVPQGQSSYVVLVNPAGYYVGLVDGSTGEEIWMDR